VQTSSGDFLEITPLGSGNEVGRSCIYIECKGCKVLLDCGIHPGKEGVQALPYFDMINPKEIDLILITHFHVDHIAGLPYFL
jgi:cleavage and polyadenylation specificity factor subunit 3